MSTFRRFGLVSMLTTIVICPPLAAQQSEPEADPDQVCLPFYEDRIVTADELLTSTVPSSAKGWWAIGWPCRKIYGGMEKGLIAFENGKIREKLYDWQRKLAEAGFRPLFGGLGQGSGIGLGTIYDIPHRETNALHFMGRLAPLSGYQEFSVNFDPSPLEGTRFNAVLDYQWRPGMIPWQARVMPSFGARAREVLSRGTKNARAMSLGVAAGACGTRVSSVRRVFTVGRL